MCGCGGGRGPAGPPGFTEFQTFAAEPETTTASLTPVAKLTTGAIVLTGGNYIIEYQAELHGTGVAPVEGGVTVDAVVQAGFELDESTYQLQGGHVVLALAAGPHTIVINYAATDAAQVATMRRARISLWRVGA